MSAVLTASLKNISSFYSKTTSSTIKKSPFPETLRQIDADAHLLGLKAHTRRQARRDREASISLLPARVPRLVHCARSRGGESILKIAAGGRKSSRAVLRGQRNEPSATLCIPITEPHARAADLRLLQIITTF